MDNLKPAVLGAMFGALIVLCMWRWTDFSNSFEIQRRLENHVTEMDSAVIIYSMRNVSHAPEVWDVGFRNKHGIMLLQYVVEPDTIFRYHRRPDYDLSMIMDSDSWRLLAPPIRKD